MIDQAPTTNIDQLQPPVLSIDHAPSSVVRQDALTAALGLAPGELFKSEAELLQRVQSLLQPEGGGGSPPGYGEGGSLTIDEGSP